jgi:hypothetical protein
MNLKGRFAAEWRFLTHEGIPALLIFIWSIQTVAFLALYLHYK